MGKWLAAGFGVLIALVALLWYQLHAPAEAAPVPDKPAPAPVAAAPEPNVPPGLEKVAAKLAAEKAAHGDKMETDSDEFALQFRDTIPQIATRNAMKCYTGGLHTQHRNAKAKFSVKETIKNGEVTMSDVKLVESTIDDPEMIACFTREIAATHMHNDKFPDVEEPDMILIRPGRNVNKFGKEAMEYEGSGPDFTKEHPNAATK